MNNQLYVAYRKIGEHKSRKRIWLQGQSLQDAGFNIGSTFKLEVDAHQIRLVLDETGSFKVSRKKQRNIRVPIVDINNQIITEFFGHFERARITFYINGLIVINYHPTDQLIAKRLQAVRQAITRRVVTTGSNAHGGGIMATAIHEGLADTGLKGELLFAIEKEQKYLESSMQNSPIWSAGSLAIEGSMDEVEPDLLSPVVLYEAGLPCTGASVAGRSKNQLAFAEQHETAGHLFYSFLSHIQRINPAIVILENVKQYANTVSLYVILDVLKGWGYQTDNAVRVLNGRQYGALENRERMFMICPTQGLEFDWELMEKFVSNETQSVADILDDIPQDSPLWSEMKGLKQKQIKDKAKGNSFKMQIVDASSNSTAVIGRGYSKIRSTEPKLAHPCKPELLRQFTPGEHARLKTIPEYLVSGLSQTVAHEVLGQSVIYQLVRALGQAVGRSLLRFNSGNKLMDAA